MMRLITLAFLTVLLIPGSVLAKTGAVTTEATRIVVIGDSISAAYGLALEDGWVQLLANELEASDIPVEIVNASISGDTTDGGLQRLPALLDRHEPHIVILELGGNDGLRGQSLKQMRSNLTDMATLAQNQGSDVLILGMRIPSNYGETYTNRFFNSFQSVADDTGAAIVPFLLEPIATSRDYFQPDGVHPTLEAQPLLMQTVLPAVKELIGSTEHSQTESQAPLTEPVTEQIMESVTETEADTATQ